MELVHRMSDWIRLSRAILGEQKYGPSKALGVLGGGPKSQGFRAVWRTFYARLRILSRQGSPEAELTPLMELDWFISPTSQTEEYCRAYVHYFLAYACGNDAEAQRNRMALQQLSVTRFTRRALLVT